MSYFQCTSYNSVIKMNGVSILPPMMTNEVRESMKHYRDLAIQKERELLLRRSAVSDSHLSKNNQKSLHSESLKTIVAVQTRHDDPPSTASSKVGTDSTNLSQYLPSTDEPVSGSYIDKPCRADGSESDGDSSATITEFSEAVPANKSVHFQVPANVAQQHCCSSPMTATSYATPNFSVVTTAEAFFPAMSMSCDNGLHTSDNVEKHGPMSLDKPMFLPVADDFLSLFNRPRSPLISDSFCVRLRQILSQERSSLVLLDEKSLSAKTSEICEMMEKLSTYHSLEVEALKMKQLKESELLKLQLSLLKEVAVSRNSMLSSPCSTQSSFSQLWCSHNANNNANMNKLPSATKSPAKNALIFPTSANNFAESFGTSFSKSTFDSCKPTFGQLSQLDEFAQATSALASTTTIEFPLRPNPRTDYDNNRKDSNNSVVDGGKLTSHVNSPCARPKPQRRRRLVALCGSSSTAEAYTARRPPVPQILKKRLGALVNGYLTRRLFQCDKVRTIIQTIKDTRSQLEACKPLEKCSTENATRSISPVDMQAQSPAQKMALISQQRLLDKSAKIHKETMNAHTTCPLTMATVKRLRQKAGLVKNSNQNVPPTSSNGQKQRISLHVSQECVPRLRLGNYSAFRASVPGYSSQRSQSVNYKQKRLSFATNARLSPPKRAAASSRGHVTAAKSRAVFRPSVSTVSETAMSAAATAVKRPTLSNNNANHRPSALQHYATSNSEYGKTSRMQKAKFQKPWK